MTIYCNKIFNLNKFQLSLKYETITGLPHAQDTLDNSKYFDIFKNSGWLRIVFCFSYTSDI